LPEAIEIIWIYFKEFEMAKKTKRKVSQVRTPVTVAETAQAPVVAETTPTPRSSFSRRSAAAPQAEFNPDYTYVVNDLKRIGLLAGSFFVVLIVLSFIIK
jgi:hypothetical protein